MTMIYPSVYNLRARANATFRLTRDFSQVAAIYNMLLSTIRMTARRVAGGYDVYSWIWVYDPVSGYATAVAPETDMAALGAGSLVYDCVLETVGGVVPLFSGYLTLVPGVTSPQSGMLGTAIAGDTVTVDGETTSSSGVVGISITDVLTACNNAVVAAASVTASGLAAQIAALSSSERNTLFQALAAAAPDATFAATGVASVTPSGFFVRAG